MLCLRIVHQNIVPVLYDRHLLQCPVLVIECAVVKGDPLAAVALDQGCVNVGPILFAEVFLLQGIPHAQPGHLFRQKGFPPVTGGPRAVRVLPEAPDLHQPNAVRRCRAKLDKLAAKGFTQGAVLMSFFRDDADDLAPLFPHPFPDRLQDGRLSGAGRPEYGEIAVGVLIVIIKVDQHGGAVVEIQAQENAAGIAELIGGKRKRSGHTSGQSVSSAFPLNIRIKPQAGEE